MREMGEEQGDEQGEQGRSEGLACQYQIGLRLLEHNGFKCEGEHGGKHRSECQGEGAPTSDDAAGSGGLQQYTTSFRCGSVNDQQQCQFSQSIKENKYKSVKTIN